MCTDRYGEYGTKTHITCARYVDPVLGLPRTVVCKEERTRDGQCGVEGKYFVRRKDQTTTIEGGADDAR